MKRIPASVRRKAERVKLLLLDVDGVLTDGSIVLTSGGEEIKQFDVRDGEGIKLLLSAGISVGLITGRSSKAVTHRARELGIPIIYQRVRDKVGVYEEIKSNTGLGDREIAYVGDDLADLPILKRVGLALAVRDCWRELQKIVDHVTEGGGGKGAVREVAEILLKAQGKWQHIIEKYSRH